MPSARTSRTKTSTATGGHQKAPRPDQPAAGSAIADAAVFAEAASIAAGAQAEVAAEVAVSARAAGVAATEKSITATARAKGAAATAFAAAQAAVAETAQILAATTRTSSVEAATVDRAQAAAAQAAAAAGAAVAAEAGWSAAMAMAGSAATLEHRLPPPAAQPTAGGGKALTRLAGLLDGLDEEVQREWEACLSTTEAPITLPVDGAGPDLARAAPGLRGLVRDLTLTRRVELALGEEEQRLRTTFDRAPMAMLRAAVDGGELVRFLRVNAALGRLTGYSEAELMELDPRALRHPDDQGDRLDQQEIVRWMHAEGHSMQVRLSLSPVHNDGRLDYVVGQAEDVTTRLRVQTALRRSEEHFRLAFDNAPIATLLIGLTGATPARLLRVNSAACRLTGFTEAELMAGDLEALLGRPTTDSGTPAGEVECRLSYRRADGHVIAMTVRGRLVNGESGQGDLLVVQLQDDPPGPRSAAVAE